MHKCSMRTCSNFVWFVYAYAVMTCVEMSCACMWSCACV